MNRVVLITSLAMLVCSVFAADNRIEVEVAPGSSLVKQWPNAETPLVFYATPKSGRFVPGSAKVTPKESWKEVANSADQAIFERHDLQKDAGKSYTWTFTGEFQTSGKGTGAVPTWTVKTDLSIPKLTYVILSPKHNAIPHGTTINYSVRALDQNFNDITDKVQFQWTTRQQRVGEDIVEKTIGTGSTKTVTWRLLLPPGSEKSPTERREAGPQYLESCAVRVEAWGMGVDRQKPIIEPHGFSLNKGSITNTFGIDTNIVRKFVGVQNLRTLYTFTVKAGAPDASGEVSATGKVAVTGSIKLTFGAKGSYKLTKNLGLEVNVGIEGQITRTSEMSVAVKGQVKSHPQFDTFVTISIGSSVTDVSWEHFTVNDYSSGFRDFYPDGTGKGPEFAPHFEIDPQLVKKP